VILGGGLAIVDGGHDDTLFYLSQEMNGPKNQALMRPVRLTQATFWYLLLVLLQIYPNSMDGSVLENVTLRSLTDENRLIY
jgi:hypothetical protein